MCESTTTLLNRLSVQSGEKNPGDFADLYCRVGDRLRCIARRKVRRICGYDNTVDTTGVVDLALLKLFQQPVMWQSGDGFFNYVSVAMHNIVIDAWRSATAQMRTSGHTRVELQEDSAISTTSGTNHSDLLMDLDQCLILMQSKLPKAHRVAVLYYLDDLSTDEIAKQLGISPVTVRGHLRRGRAFLMYHLQDYGRQSR